MLWTGAKQPTNHLNQTEPIYESRMTGELTLYKTAWHQTVKKHTVWICQDYNMTAWIVGAKL